MAVTVRADGDAFNVEIPRPLFQMRARSSGYGGFGAYNYDVTRDGQRFVVNQSEGEGGMPPTVILNWVSLLSR